MSNKSIPKIFLTKIFLLCYYIDPSYQPTSPSTAPTSGTLRVESTPAPAVPETSPVHTHNFQYVLMQDASETQDAVLLLQCNCGAVTIPAGYEVTTLIDENGYCGFRHLDQIFDGNEVTRN